MFNIKEQFYLSYLLFTLNTNYVIQVSSSTGQSATDPNGDPVILNTFPTGTLYTSLYVYGNGVKNEEIETDIQNKVNSSNKKVDELISNKEKDIMTI